MTVSKQECKIEKKALVLKKVLEKALRAYFHYFILATLHTLIVLFFHKNS